MCDGGCRKGGRAAAMAFKTVLALVTWSMFCAAVQAQNFDFFYFVQQVGGYAWVFHSGRIERIAHCVGVPMVS